MSTHSTKKTWNWTTLWVASTTFPSVCIGRHATLSYPSFYKTSYGLNQLAQLVVWFLNRRLCWLINKELQVGDSEDKPTENHRLAWWVGHIPFGKNHSACQFGMLFWISGKRELDHPTNKMEEKQQQQQQLHLPRKLPKSDFKTVSKYLKYPKFPGVFSSISYNRRLATSVLVNALFRRWRRNGTWHLWVCWVFMCSS